MLAEKLLLHVFVILAPILVYTSFFENRRIGQSPYFIGMMYGVSAVLCLTVSYYSYGLYWDLRYVPLVLSVLYGGPVAGAITFISIIGARTFMSGDALLFGYISASLAASVPFLFVKRFWRYQARKRIITAIWLGIWPSFIMFSILISWLIFSRNPVDDLQELMLYVLLFGVIQIVGIGFASMLHEAVIERRMMRKEMQRAEKLNTLGELAASIAHEVRNPLTVVKGFLQLMKSQEKKNDNYQYLSLVLSELARAEAIINDYLNFAKPQFEKIERLELSSTMSDVIALLQPLAMKQGVGLDSQLEEEVYLHTDRNQFKQALVNIIKNAIEATALGGRINVILSSDGQDVKITVKDNGKGMTKEQLSRIGTLFYTTKDKGTGLGTMVSLRIIEAMEGKITYKSELGKGTEVRVALPMNRHYQGRGDIRLHKKLNKEQGAGELKSFE
ncbi:two-component sensor histidine kinase [Rossellomorea vietnamensis]|uniref:histidine kinase n=1 Tax=Rossellomorea vietnamensis TaxID=218284 RepID=A0A5D4KHF0_9BACI|nr:ATP-binding protein [Rossellomorea vietnamensis]TYR75693.1 two-component sensor histidine kinase [Rossellomorea vietnamensis]